MVINNIFKQTLSIVVDCVFCNHSFGLESQPLFNEDLSNAMYDKSVWTLTDGVLSATEDKEIWTVAEYENFKLDLEFKTDIGTTSGVIVYCTDRGNWIPNSVEVQIADDYSEKWATAPTNFQCGAIFGHLPAAEQKVVKQPGEWNRMSVVCKGQQIVITLNGKKVTEMDMGKWTSGKKIRTDRIFQVGYRSRLLNWRPKDILVCRGNTEML